MKSLIEFIEQDLNGITLDTNKVYSDFTNEEFYWHLVLEYNKKYLFEAYSFVQEICGLSPKIIKKIQNNINKDKIIYKTTNDSFFKIASTIG